LIFSQVKGCEASFEELIEVEYFPPRVEISLVEALGLGNWRFSEPFKKKIAACDQVSWELRPRHKQSRHPLFEGGGLKRFDQFLQVDLGGCLIEGNAAVVFNIGQAAGNLFELLVADDFGIH
jgi:hypothetical protein